MGAMEVLKHPETAAERDPIIYEAHVPTTNGTAGYNDVRKAMAAMKSKLDRVGVAASFMLGDQQTFCRMLWLKRMETWPSVIPLPGDFHFAVHMLMVMHTLWYKTLVEWVLEETSFCEESIKEHWQSVELYNRHRFLYETIIVAIIAYLSGVLPAGCFDDPESLLEAAQHNRGTFPGRVGHVLKGLVPSCPGVRIFLKELKETCHLTPPARTGLEVLVRFLFDFALPWMLFRWGIRAGDAELMDSIYPLALGWFRVTNKYNYSRLCVDYAYVLQHLNPALLAVWKKYRTCSLVGNDGRNVAWDQANEFMNLNVKMSKPTDPSNIDKIITMLNGYFQAEAHVRQAVGEERTQPSEYTPVKIEHVQRIVDAFKSKLGSTEAEVRAIRASNPFGDDKKPWVSVKNPSMVTPNPTKQVLFDAAVDWTLQRLDDAPFPVD